MSLTAHSQTFLKGPALIEGVTSTATAGATTTLTKDSQTNQRFTGVTTQTVVLPAATTLPVGRYFQIENRSTGLVTVQTNGGGALTTVLPNMQKQVLVLTIGTAAGTWDVTNIKIDLADTANVTGILALINGGTNKAATASAGSVAYSDADSFEFSAVGTTGQILISNGTGAPAWTSTPTILDTTYYKQNGNSFTANAVLGTNDNFSQSFETNNTTRLTLDNDGSFTWTLPATENGLIQLGIATADTNDIRIARGSSGLTPFDGSPLKVSNTTSEAAARSQYGAEFVTIGQNTVATTTRYGGLIGIGEHTSAFNLTATDVGLVGVIGLSRNTGAAAASTTSNSAGGSFVVGNNSTNEVVTNAFGTRVGMDASITNTVGGVTNLFGYYMRDQTGGSTFDGAAITGIPAATNRWNIYVNDASNNYINGTLLIGQKSSTTRTSNLATTSSILDLNSTTGALLLPRMTTTQKNALTAAAGMQVYDTTLGQFSLYNGAWLSPMVNPMTTAGDIIYGGASGVPTRLAVGSDQQILKVVSGIPAWAWPLSSQTSQSTTYAILATDNLVLLSSSGGAFTATLPTAASMTGKVISIKKTDSTFNIITIATTSSQTIDGVTTTTLNTQNELLTVTSDGSNWQILNRRIPSICTIYTPTTNGFGTPTGVNFSWCRAGDRVQVYGRLVTGTVTAAEARIGIPTSTCSGTVTGGLNAPMGTFARNVAGTVVERYLFTAGGAAYLMFGVNDTVSAPFTAQNGNAIFSSGETVGINFSCAVTGWAG